MTLGVNALRASVRRESISDDVLLAAYDMGSLGSEQLCQCQLYPEGFYQTAAVELER